jgi:hypothetical protein
VRAASWWYVGQMPVGNAAVVALALGAADFVALADAEAADELAATGDDAAAETGAGDEAAADDAAAEVGAADDAGGEETGADAAGVACLLDVQAASMRLPPTMAVSARRCPIASSVPTSGTIFSPMH